MEGILRRSEDIVRPGHKIPFPLDPYNTSNLVGMIKGRMRDAK